MNDTANSFLWKNNGFMQHLSDPFWCATLRGIAATKPAEKKTKTNHQNKADNYKKKQWTGTNTSQKKWSWVEVWLEAKPTQVCRQAADKCSPNFTTGRWEYVGLEGLLKEMIPTLLQSVFILHIQHTGNSSCIETGLTPWQGEMMRKTSSYQKANL